jgi:hypothetical protein
VPSSRSSTGGIRTAINVAWRVQERLQLHVTLDALIGLATLIAQADNVERAVELLTLVRGLASIDRRTETKAERLLAEALAIAERCGDPQGISRAHKELGYLALKQGALGTAGRHWRTAISIAVRVQDRPHLLLTLDALIGLATLMAQTGDLERAVELLTLVRRAACSDRHTQTRAEQVLAELESRLPPSHLAAAEARGRALQLDATITAILAEALVSHAP